MSFSGSVHREDRLAVLRDRLVSCRSYAGMCSAGTGGHMVTPPDETTADPYAVIAALRQQLAERSAERDVALAEKAALAKALTTRNSEYGERIEHQSATIDVLK